MWSCCHLWVLLKTLCTEFRLGAPGGWSAVKMNSPLGQLIPPQAARQRQGSCSQITSPSPPDLACRAKPFHSAIGFHIMWLNNETLNQPERKVYSNIWLLSLLTRLWRHGQTQLTCSVQWLPFKNYASHSCWAQHITGRCRYNPWRTLSKECVVVFFSYFPQFNIH